MLREQDLKQAIEFREAVHREALVKARASYPAIDTVVDKHPAEDYCTEHWDYPGKWYPMASVPYGYKSREALIDEIVAATIENYLQGKAAVSEEPFWAVIADYPDCVVEYAIVPSEEPYCSYQSHFDALMQGAMQIFNDEWQLRFTIGKITAKEVSPRVLSAPVDENGALNYRKAFLCPPYPHNYTDADFDKINAALFPNGIDQLSIYQWSTDWSDYFDEGNEWWGTLCLTVYDASLDRFVVIMASATE